MKKKWWLSALAAAGAMCLFLGLAACGGGSSDGEVSGNLRFRLDSSTDTYSVSKNDSAGPISGTLEIPASFREKPVTRIERSGFEKCSGLISVELKNGQSPKTAAKFKTIEKSQSSDWLFSFR